MEKRNRFVFILHHDKEYEIAREELFPQSETFRFLSSVILDGVIYSNSLSVLRIGDTFDKDSVELFVESIVNPEMPKINFFSLNTSVLLDLYCLWSMFGLNEKINALTSSFPAFYQIQYNKSSDILELFNFNYLRKMGVSNEPFLNYIKIYFLNFIKPCYAVFAAIFAQLNFSELVFLFKKNPISKPNTKDVIIFILNQYENHGDKVFLLFRYVDFLKLNPSDWKEVGDYLSERLTKIDYSTNFSFFHRLLNVIVFVFELFEKKYPKIAPIPDFTPSDFFDNNVSAMVSLMRTKATYTDKEFQQTIKSSILQLLDHESLDQRFYWFRFCCYSIGIGVCKDEKKAQEIYRKIDFRVNPFSYTLFENNSLLYFISRYYNALNYAENNFDYLCYLLCKGRFPKNVNQKSPKLSKIYFSLDFPLKEEAVLTLFLNHAVFDNQRNPLTLDLEKPIKVFSMINYKTDDDLSFDNNYPYAKKRNHISKNSKKTSKQKRNKKECNLNACEETRSIIDDESKTCFEIFLTEHDSCLYEKPNDLSDETSINNYKPTALIEDIPDFKDSCFAVRLMMKLSNK